MLYHATYIYKLPLMSHLVNIITGRCTIFSSRYYENNNKYLVLYLDFLELKTSFEVQQDLVEVIWQFLCIEDAHDVIC